MLKKIISITVTIMLLAVSSVAVSPEKVTSEEPLKTLCVSEYDILSGQYILSEDSEENARILKEMNEEATNELLYRKTLGDEELRNYYGYSDKDIAILRNYNGEEISSQQELRALQAVLTFETPEVVSADADGIHLSVGWSWDKKPSILRADGIALYWSPTFDHAAGNLRINTSMSYLLLQYWTTQSTIYYDADTHFTVNQPTRTAKSEFDLSAHGGWARWGTAHIYLDATEGSGSLSSVDFIIKYGHATVTATPEFTFPVAGTVSITGTTVESDSLEGYVDIGENEWVSNQID